MDKYQLTATQFMKFVVVGFMNTALDFLILNTLVHVTGITGGVGIIPLNVVSFTVATTNSFFLNKRWSFHDTSHVHEGRKFTMFLLVSIVGVLINTSIVWFISSTVDPMFGAGKTLWLNIAKACATAISLFWNFYGYKYIVFKK